MSKRNIKLLFLLFQYDCALYSHNLTASLQSLHILLQPPTVTANAPKTTSLPDSQVVTPSGTLYRTLPWRVPPPYQTDSTKLIGGNSPTNVTHCLFHCDAIDACIAVQTMFDVKGTLSKCFLISSEEYFPDNGAFPKRNETSLIQIRVTNIENTLLQSQVNFNQKYQKASLMNSYLSIIDAASRYELNEPLAEKLN